MKLTKFTPSQCRIGWTLLAGALLGSLIAELLYPTPPQMGVDGTPFFGLWSSLLACLLWLAILACLRPLLRKRP